MKKESKKRYPDNWQYISSFIRFERAKNRCENCGLKNGIIIKRLKHSKIHELTFKELTEVQKFIEYNKLSEKQALKKLGITKIVLTVAHLDHNESNNNHENLKALCQRCHLQHDRINNQYRSKYYKQQELPNLFLNNK
jgi:ribosomal protein S14